MERTPRTKQTDGVWNLQHMKLLLLLFLFLLLLLERHEQGHQEIHSQLYTMLQGKT